MVGQRTVPCPIPGQPNRHPHDEQGGHNHDWTDGKRGPAYVPENEKAFGGNDLQAMINPGDIMLGAGLVFIAGVGIAFVAADDATGIGVIDDVLYGPLAGMFGEGLRLLAGG